MSERIYLHTAKNPSGETLAPDSSETEGEEGRDLGQENEAHSQNTRTSAHFKTPRSCPIKDIHNQRIALKRTSAKIE